MTERNDRYEEDNYYRREERDDPNEMDRDESLNDCLLEIARLANDARALTIRPEPREFYLYFKDSWSDGKSVYTTRALLPETPSNAMKVREVLE